MERRRKIYLDSEIQKKKQYQKFLPSQLPFFIQIKFLKSDSTSVLIKVPRLTFLLTYAGNFRKLHVSEKLGYLVHLVLWYSDRHRIVLLYYVRAMIRGQCDLKSKVTR